MSNWLEYAKSAFRLLEEVATTRMGVSISVLTACQHSQHLPIIVTKNHANIQQPFPFAPLAGPQTQLTHFSLPDGSHMAGLVAGLTFGVAKKTTIRCVKIKGKDQDIVHTDMQDAVSRVLDEVQTSGEPSVVLMSFNGVDQAIDPIVCTPPVQL
jgi:hypothetical protein